MRNAIIHLNWSMVLICTGIYVGWALMWYRLLIKQWAGGAEQANVSGLPRWFEMIAWVAALFLICTATGILVNAIRCKLTSDCFIRSYILLAALVGGLVVFTHAWRHRPLRLWIIDAVFHLVGLAAATLLLARWGMTSAS